MNFIYNNVVRFVIESNIDGYLYVFHAENDSAPQMIFPDYRINQGANGIVAHVPYELPSRRAEIKWFTFDENPSTENLYIVLTRQLLPHVPTGLALAAYCEPKDQECVWKPSQSQLSELLSNFDGPKILSSSRAIGQAQDKVELEAIERGIKLRSEAPEPTFIYMNASAKSGILVMKTQLIHRKRPENQVSRR